MFLLQFDIVSRVHPGEVIPATLWGTQLAFMTQDVKLVVAQSGLESYVKSCLANLGQFNAQFTYKLHEKFRNVVGVRIVNLEFNRTFGGP
jgi:hypothetical protein